MINSLDLEKTISNLSPTDLVKFRAWFADFDGEAWDRQFEADVESGRLEKLGADALAEHAARKTSSRRGEPR